MYSTKPIPLPYAGSFNFTFDVGTGIEVYRARMRSIRVKYRYHHISNNDTAIDNPGIDNGLLRLLIHSAIRACSLYLDDGAHAGVTSL